MEWGTQAEQGNGPSCGPALASGLPRVASQPPTPLRWAIPGRTRILKATFRLQGAWAGHPADTSVAPGRSPVSSAWRVSQPCPAGHWPLPAGGGRGLLILALQDLQPGCSQKGQRAVHCVCPRWLRVPAVLREARSPDHGRARLAEGWPGSSGLGPGPCHLCIWLTPSPRASAGHCCGNQACNPLGGTPKPGGSECPGPERSRA